MRQGIAFQHSTCRERTGSTEAFFAGTARGLIGSSRLDPRYEIRAVTHDDEDDLLELARYLDSVNLPAERDEMQPIIALSDDSFSGAIADPRHRRYVFVLRDLHEDRAVGSSMIVSQLGRRDAPYIFYSVREEERYSSTVDKHFIHKVLKIGYSYDGPTEIGGLVMHPEYRRVAEKLGMQISYVRFLFIAMRRAEFQNYVLAELMPPLAEDGTSHLWEAVGRHFTGMTYREADRLSRRNKEFIRGLFPPGDIYASLLPADAQAVIGKVGRDTRGVEKLLRRIGFEYVDRVDPFDGGPHFAGKTDKISLIRDAGARTIALDANVVDASRALVARTYPSSPWFKAIAVPARIDDAEVALAPAAARHLELAAGDTAWVLPLT